MYDSIELPKPDDFHVHFRRGPATANYAKRHAAVFGRALAMPNTLPPVASGAEVGRYRDELAAAAAAPGFTPLMSFKLLPEMSATTVRECAAAGAIAGKYYPAGATTNSSDGLASPEAAEEALSAMEELDMVLCVHGEDPEAPVFEREAAFLPVLERILALHPRLRIVLEHVSSARGMRFVLDGPERLGATVTAVHLLHTLEDMLGEGMNPHLYCKPILKTAADRAALREAVFSSAPRVFFGSDSAPHPRASKECPKSASGVYSAPTALPALAGLFASEGAPPAALANFVAGAGASFYRLPPATEKITLVRSPWTVPGEMDGSVPLAAGSILEWRVRGASTLP